MVFVSGACESYVWYLLHPWSGMLFPLHMDSDMLIQSYIVGELTTE